MREIRADTLLSIVTFFRKDRRSFPAIVDWILSWLANLFLATRYYYGYVKSTQRSVWNASRSLATDELESFHNIPLTTRNRNLELESTFAQVVEQLEKLLETIHRKKDDNTDLFQHPARLVRLLRSSVNARKLASQAMSIQREKPTISTVDGLTDSQRELWTQIQQQWPQLLQLPKTDQIPEHPFSISLVVPVYAENGRHVRANLQRALSSSQEPSRIQLVVVDAGGNSDLHLATQFGSDPHVQWGQVLVISHSTGGGRGPTLNAGARHATGKILTFLHADNILPDRWDQEIRSALEESTTIACAFSFRINTTPQALNENGGNHPPGLSAAQWMGTLRSERFRVLYGDSVLSLPAVYFTFWGGFPDQALMEDYEVMDLLRKRVALFSRRETVRILAAETLVSPRRWQIHGVPYVTLFNCLCVYLYQERGWSPERLYQFYYQRQSSKS